VFSRGLPFFRSYDLDVGAPRGLLRFFNDLEDPHIKQTKLHSLSDILVIALCAVICGADN